jgi:hypothetical protein
MSSFTINLFDAIHMQDMRLNDYIIEHSARLADLEALAGFYLLPELKPQDRVNAVTFLPEKLWDRVRWFDAFADDQCPLMETVHCPAGYNNKSKTITFIYDSLLSYDEDHPPVLLISLTSHNYLDRGLTPVLNRLKACGTSAPFMRSIYPTITFPNHYSAVTVLPARDRHSIYYTHCHTCIFCRDCMLRTTGLSTTACTMTF